MSSFQSLVLVSLHAYPMNEASSKGRKHTQSPVTVTGVVWYYAKTCRGWPATDEAFRRARGQGRRVGDGPASAPDLQSAETRTGDGRAWSSSGIPSFHPQLKIGKPNQRRKRKPETVGATVPPAKPETFRIFYLCPLPFRFFL